MREGMRMNWYEAVVELRQLTLHRQWIIKTRRSVTVASVASLIGALALPAFAETASGLLNGIARNSITGMPVAGVQVIAHSLDRGLDRTTLTNNEGLFTFSKVEPGRYELAASKNGFQKLSANVEVAPSRTIIVEFPLSATAGVPSTTTRSERPESAPLTGRELELLARIDRLEARLAAVESKDRFSAQAGEASDTTATLAAETSISDRVSGPTASAESALPD